MVLSVSCIQRSELYQAGLGEKAIEFESLNLVQRASVHLTSQRLKVVDDQATAKVEELPTFLSELEKTTLEHVSWQNIITEEQMIHNSTIA